MLKSPGSAPIVGRVHSGPRPVLSFVLHLLLVFAVLLFVLCEVSQFVLWTQVWNWSQISCRLHDSSEQIVSVVEDEPLRLHRQLLHPSVTPPVSASLQVLGFWTGTRVWILPYQLTADPQIGLYASCNSSQILCVIFNVKLFFCYTESEKETEVWEWRSRVERTDQKQFKQWITVEVLKFVS